MKYTIAIIMWDTFVDNKFSPKLCHIWQSKRTLRVNALLHKSLLGVGGRGKILLLFVLTQIFPFIWFCIAQLPDSNFSTKNSGLRPNRCRCYCGSKPYIYLHSTFWFCNLDHRWNPRYIFRCHYIMQCSVMESIAWGPTMTLVFLT